MSNLDVVPVGTIGITFGQVVTETERNLKLLFGNHGAAMAPNTDVQIVSNNGSHNYSITSDCFFEWEEDYYAWVFADGVTGGIEITCTPFGADQERIGLLPWNGGGFGTSVNHQHEVLQQASKFNRCWSFNCSEDGDLTTTRMMVMLAAAVAGLSDGLIYSDDQVWQYGKLYQRSLSEVEAEGCASVHESPFAILATMLVDVDPEITL